MARIGEPHQRPRQVAAAGLPGHGEAAVEHGVGDLRRLVERLPRLGVGRPEGDAVEAELGERRGEAVVDERELRPAGAAGELQELQPVADGAHRAYQVVAEPGADQRAELGLAGMGRAHRRDREGDMEQFLEPGMLVRHPDRPDWGLGQVQSVIRDKITVNFEHAGKVVIDGSRIDLAPQEGAPEG